MRIRFIQIMLLVVFTNILIIAQAADLTTEDVTITTDTGVFGQEVTTATGILVNNGQMAYQDIDIFAEVYAADDTLIGEGVGLPVNACGSGLLPSFALQPGASQPFSVVLDLFEAGEVDRVLFFPEAEAVEPTPIDTTRVFQGIQTVTRGEVVDIEWIDETTLRYATGCDGEVFTSHQWRRYDLESGETANIVHPNEQDVTDALLQQLGLTDPMIYERSYLAFPPNSRRIIYQTDINTVITAEPDGSFKRLIYDNLARRSLHGYIWLPQGRFLAYYYGAYGEDVVYFTASMEGQRISSDIYSVVPSQTIPGPTSDGGRVIITTAVDGVTGYYIQQTGFPANELLIETDEIPGNNWPAPIYTTDAEGREQVYIMRPVEDIPRLQCLDLVTRDLNTLTTLPLQLTPDDRAWSWLSPDGSQIALAANGINGGLWLINLDELGGCVGG